MGALAEMLRVKGLGAGAVGTFLGTQFSHVPWEGLHLYDVIFPLFIFLTGVSIVLSLPALVERPPQDSGGPSTVQVAGPLFCSPRLAAVLDWKAVIPPSAGRAVIG